MKRCQWGAGHKYLVTGGRNLGLQTDMSYIAWNGKLGRRNYKGVHSLQARLGKEGYSGKTARVNTSGEEGCEMSF